MVWIYLKTSFLAIKFQLVILSLFFSLDMIFQFYRNEKVKSIAMLPLFGLTLLEELEVVEL